MSKLFGSKSIPAEIQHIPEDIGQPTSDIPSVSAPIRLADGEVCCLALLGTWSRRQKGRRRYKGAGLSIRAAKGIWLRGGGGQSDPEISVEKISGGRLFVTTERLVFHGDAKSTTINLRDAADIQYGPDHFQVTIENKPTEIFTVDQEILNHKKVRLLISRVWLVAREGDFDKSAAQSDATDTERQKQIEVLKSEIDQLTDAIEDESGFFDNDLQKLQRITTVIRELEAIDTSRAGSPQLYIEGPRAKLIIRALTDEQDGNSPPTETQCRLEQIREIAKPVSPFLSELDIFTAQRRQGWPFSSAFEGQSGLAGQTFDLATEAQMYFEPSAEDDLDSFLGNFDAQSKTRKMGTTIFALILDCEALAIRSNVTELSDATLFAYIAAIATAEKYCVEQFGPAYWAEADEHSSLAAGVEKLDFISRFIAELDDAVGEGIATSYKQMESTIAEDIGSRLSPKKDPWDSYRDAIEAAETYWVELVGAAGVAGDNVDSKNHTETATQIMGGTDVKSRLDHIKSLFDKGVISELEYQRQRQRILDQI